MRYRKSPALIATAILITLPWVHNTSLATLFPNQSGLRFLGFSLAILSMALASRTSNLPLASFCLAFISFFCIMFNTETGIIIFISLGAYLFCRLDKTNVLAIGVNLSAWVGGIFLAIIFGAIIIKASIGYWPNITLAQALHEVTSRAGGYGGFQFAWRIDTIVLGLLAFYIITLFLQPFFTNRWWHSMPSASAETIGICSIFLIWAAYYFYRPVPWNM
ncbi:MAG: hypothetical protein P8Z77_17495, partial [Candidatus Thiodiazotropha sp.]